jgi:hypothetical protein
MFSKSHLRELVGELRPHAVWETIKWLSVLAAPTIIASSYAVWQKARHLSVDWYVFGGLFVVSTILFATAMLVLLMSAKLMSAKRMTADEQMGSKSGVAEREPRVTVTTVSDHTRDDGDESNAIVYLEREDLYKDIVETIKRVSSSQRGQKALLLTGLRGESGPRRTTLLHSNPAFASFDNEMRNCIDSVGPDMWYVRELYNIADDDRLQMILDRIRQAPRSEGYEVRAYCVRNPIPQFKPLIVGREDLFLAVDDPTYYRVRAGMHIRGSGFVSLATTHFDQLWTAQLPRLFKLRGATGEDSPEIKLLSEAISKLHAQENGPQPFRQSASRTDFLRSGIWAVLGQGSATIQTILLDLQVRDPADRDEVLRLLGVLVEEEKIETDTSKPSGYYRLRRPGG